MSKTKIDKFIIKGKGKDCLISEVRQSDLYKSFPAKLPVNVFRAGTKREACRIALAKGISLKSLIEQVQAYKGVLCPSLDKVRKNNLASITGTYMTMFRALQDETYKGLRPARAVKK
jgi:hypothetical protein